MPANGLLKPFAFIYTHHCVCRSAHIPSGQHNRTELTSCASLTLALKAVVLLSSSSRLYSARLQEKDSSVHLIYPMQDGRNKKDARGMEQKSAVLKMGIAETLSNRTVLSNI